MLLTAAFVFSVFVLAADKHKGGFLAPIGIGLSLFLAQLVGLPFTGAGLNPARSFATAVLNRHFPTYHWIYWLAPMVGGVLAAGFYKLTKFLELETAIGMRGESALGHRRGVSNASSNATAGGVMAQAHHGHALHPVQEHGDLEKGSQGGIGGVGVHDANASDSDTTNDLRSPRVGGH
ncbi:Aquaporin-1 [Oleoguttula sp. CCFEE 5521]